MCLEVCSHFQYLVRSQCMELNCQCMLTTTTTFPHPPSWDHNTWQCFWAVPWTLLGIPNSHPRRTSPFGEWSHWLYQPRSFSSSGVHLWEITWTQGIFETLHVLVSPNTYIFWYLVNRKLLLCATSLLSMQVNPFRQQICEIFATSDTGMMSFIEFLDMVSAFSPKVTVVCHSCRTLPVVCVCVEGGGKDGGGERW